MGILDAPADISGSGVQTWCGVNALAVRGSHWSRKWVSKSATDGTVIIWVDCPACWEQAPAEAKVARIAAMLAGAETWIERIYGRGEA